jgi:hypothetical protein
MSDTQTKSPIRNEPPPVHRDEPKKGPLTDINIPKQEAAQTFDPPPKVRPNFATADIQPIRRTANTTIVAALRGGPFDGVEVDVPAMAMTHQAVYETAIEDLTPFQFDPEEHAAFVRSGGKEGKPNVIKGDHDTVTYRRTGEKTQDGAFVFQAVA